MPDAAVVVATVRALKYHGGVEVADLDREDLNALRAGMENLRRHLVNVREIHGIPCVVALNQFPGDTPAEVDLVLEMVGAEGVKAFAATHYFDGGAGATDLANGLLTLLGERAEPSVSFTYEDDLSLVEKVEIVARRLYGAGQVTRDPKAARRLQRIEGDGYRSLPVCIAKTQYSFSTDPHLRGAPSGHDLHVSEVRLSAGAGFVVVICGDVMTMPGLPAVPASTRIDLTDDGEIVGLS